MAAAIIKGCVKCGKTGGVLLCNGCQQTLCFKHVNEHKDEIDQIFQDLINQENQFENDLSKEDDSHFLFNEIDTWKKQAIEQIKQIAKQAKDDLRQKLSQSNQDILTNCLKLKENLNLLKQSEDLSEIELNKLSNEFQQLKTKTNSFQLIKSTNNFFLSIIKEEIKPILEPKPPNDKVSPYFDQTHVNTKGSILIREIDPYGHFILIENNGSTHDKQQDMIGWSLKRSIDSYREFVYRFPSDFIFKSNSSIKILSKQASQTIYSYEKDNTLVADAIQTWGTPVKTANNTLFDANGDERDLLIQTYK